MTEFQSKGQRFVALCMLGIVLFNYPILALFNVSGALWRAVRRTGALRLYIHRLGGADRSDGVHR